MKEHSSVRRLHLFAQGLSTQADRKSHFPRLVVSPDKNHNSFPSRKTSDRQNRWAERRSLKPTSWSTPSPGAVLKEVMLQNAACLWPPSPEPHLCRPHALFGHRLHGGKVAIKMQEKADLEKMSLHWASPCSWASSWGVRGFTLDWHSAINPETCSKAQC